MEGGGGSVALSDDTKKRVAAAKSYIENMYKVQHQNIQERYARRVTVYAILLAGQGRGGSRTTQLRLPGRLAQARCLAAASS
ncbi:hypothetical protein MNEG_10289 [Monoraphidium neglectum]|uniref:Uncharacterized protein n=1 Tax=Monoraphidium neglectum TaxID=145388 RepID=A0A0D2M220_9CHLO|nr:hypothetical protein MNEG_10289 [Monoraphidium neglectum]KIY97674.1 hypothetical protein MNEG_10289 [Monoraphidium neglectum]|eukprot:XP_013896694.1 hypothetical protein MNEG_10289 [Monoraphidium neglectum]